MRPGVVLRVCFSSRFQGQLRRKLNFRGSKPLCFLTHTHTHTQESMSFDTQATSPSACTAKPRAREKSERPAGEGHMDRLSFRVLFCSGCATICRFLYASLGILRFVSCSCLFLFVSGVFCEVRACQREVPYFDNTQGGPQTSNNLRTALAQLCNAA